MTASDCLPHQVTINKPELSARWGITLESKPQIGGAPKAPTITKLADGGLAIISGKIKVTHLLIAVNGTIVKGHEDGTTLLKNAVGNTELTLYAPEIAAAKAAAAALAAGERPLPIGIGKTSSSWKKVPSASRPGGMQVLTTAPSLLSPQVPSASRPGAFSYLHEPSGYVHKPDCLPNCMRDYLHEPSGYGHKPDCLPSCMCDCVRAAF